MGIKENLIELKTNLPDNVKLVAVSKKKPISDIQQVYDVGHRVFGENKVQEMCDKQKMLPKDIKWHMIGHLQRNKVKYIAPFVDLIHAVDSLKLLQEIQKQAKKNKRVIKCLLQIKIAQEHTKFGLTPDQAQQILDSEALKSMQAISITGLMGMATLTQNNEQIRDEFNLLKSVFDRFKEQMPGFQTISMGMSNDYQIAIEQGSNLIRVGSAVFGKRSGSA